MAKEKTQTLGIDIDKLVADARSIFLTSAEKSEAGMAEQITPGSAISRPTDDDEFVCYPDSHWEKLLGIKGIPYGRIIQIAGRPDSGKSSHAMAFMKHAQDQGCLVILWDPEKKFSAVRFDKFFKGDSKNLVAITAKIILEGVDQVHAVVMAAHQQNPHQKILLVWDSVGATLSASEDEKQARQSKQTAEEAKDNGRAMRRIILDMEKVKDKERNRENLAVLLINQVYSDVRGKGSKESGGQKVEFHSSIILQLTRKKDLFQTRGGVKYKVGIVTRARVKKNHLFDGDSNVAELDLIVTAGGIKLFKDIKVKKGKQAEDSQTDEFEVDDDGESEDEGSDE